MANEVNEVPMDQSGVSSTDEKKAPHPQLEPVSSFTKENIHDASPIMSFVSASGKQIEVTGDVDQAMEYALDDDDTYDPVADAKLLRKIDLNILPIVGLLYAIQFMDKITLSSAAILKVSDKVSAGHTLTSAAAKSQGLKADLNLVGQEYSWAGSAFYFGYLFFEIPGSMLLQRFPLAKTTTLFIVLWGIIICLHAVVKDAAGIITIRVFLGIFESGITPAMVFFMSQYYRQSETFLRSTCWFACNGIGWIMGSAIGYGLAMHGLNYNMALWKILYIICGLMTLVVAIIFFFQVPDLPTNAYWLNEKERKLMVTRIRANQQGFGNHHFKKAQLKECLLDPSVWLWFIFALASNIPNGAITNFGTIVLSGLGYTDEKSLLLNMPSGAVEVVVCIGLAGVSYYTGGRVLMSVFGMVVALTCSCLLAWAPTQVGRLCGYYFCVTYVLGMICGLSCFSSNVAGHTKKVVGNAIYLIGYCVGNIVGPQTFRAKESPQYTSGKIAFVVTESISLVVLVIIYFNYKRLNAKKARELKRMEEEEPEELAKLKNIEFADMTDFENPFFRYTL